mgnify:CR=1 FL=1
MRRGCSVSRIRFNLPVGLGPGDARPFFCPGAGPAAQMVLPIGEGSLSRCTGGPGGSSIRMRSSPASGCPSIGLSRPTAMVACGSADGSLPGSVPTEHHKRGYRLSLRVAGGCGALRQGNHATPCAKRLERLCAPATFLPTRKRAGPLARLCARFLHSPLPPSPRRGGTCPIGERGGRRRGWGVAWKTRIEWSDCPTAENAGGIAKAPFGPARLVSARSGWSGARAG